MEIAAPDQEGMNDETKSEHARALTNETFTTTHNCLEGCGANPETTLETPQGKGSTMVGELPPTLAALRYCYCVRMWAGFAV